jgi:hypothetical protein
VIALNGRNAAEAVLADADAVSASQARLGRGRRG